MKADDSYAVAVAREILRSGGDELMPHLEGRPATEALAILGYLMDRILNQIEDPEFRVAVREKIIQGIRGAV